jgi:GT2 family glycosyltransferase
MQLVRFLDAHPDVGIVGPTLLNGDGTVQLSWAEFPTLWSEIRGINVRRRRRYMSSDGSETYAVDWVGGACLLIRRAAADQIGPLDERYFMYSEETDWCFRARRCGWEVCIYPTARVTHLGGQSSRKASARMKAELYRSKIRFFSKHYSWLSAQAFRLLLQSLFLSRAILGWLLYRGSLKLSRRAGALYYDSLEVIRVVGSRLESSRS